MAGHKNKKLRIAKSLLPKPKNIMKRGLYEVMWGAPQRNYEKRVKEGRY